MSLSTPCEKFQFSDARGFRNRTQNSTCPSLRRSAWTWTRSNPFEANGNRQFTGDEVSFYGHLREHVDAAVASMKSAEVWSGLAEWIPALAGVATLHPEQIKH